MAHGLNSVLKRGVSGVQGCKSEGKTGIGSRRIFPPHFKLQVLDSYRNDADCKGNQRATARKYGIHRRQIQKWLQVENVLRNSVNKGSSGSGTAPGPKSADCGNANNNGGEIPEARKCGIDVALSNRQRDDVGCADMCPPAATSGVPDARVPSLAPPYGALDYTTHSRRSDDPAAPMDLSFKRPASRSAPVLSVSFAPLLAPPLASPPLVSTPSSLVSTTTTTTTTTATATHPDVWDLSTKTKTKRKCDEDRLVSPKPVKLFKPYLNDDDDNADHDNNDVDVDVDGDVEDRLPPSRLELVAPVKLEPLPCCPYIHDAAYYYNNNNNNNNNVCDIKSEYNNVPYTLHELQPKSSIHYYYTDKTGAYTYPSTLYSPEYEPNPYTCSYDDSCLHGVAPLKQRQSYSLDFKLQAIDSYYEDSQCKGNQRAVASKYNIHRRQVQKWLKQEEELRQRNENVKMMHAVS